MSAPPQVNSNLPSFSMNETSDTPEDQSSITMFDPSVVASTIDGLPNDMAPSVSLFDRHTHGPGLVTSSGYSDWHKEDHYTSLIQEDTQPIFSSGYIPAYQHHPDPLPIMNTTSYYFSSAPATLNPADLNSPNLSDFHQSDTDDLQTFDTSTAISGMPSWMNRDSPYPEIMSDNPHIPPSTAPTSPWIGRRREESYLEDDLRAPRASDAEQPYAQWLYTCLKQAPGHQMILRDIYKWGKDNVAKVQEVLAQNPNAKGWQNSIRHNLSMNQAFVKVDIPGNGDGKKATGWRLSDEALREQAVQSTTRYRKKVTGKVKALRGGIRSGRITKARRNSRHGSHLGNILSPSSPPLPSPTPSNSPLYHWQDPSCSRSVPNLPPLDRLHTMNAPVSHLTYMRSPGLSNMPPLSPSLGSPSLQLTGIDRISTPQTPPLLEPQYQEPHIFTSMSPPTYTPSLAPWSENLYEDEVYTTYNPAS